MDAWADPWSETTTSSAAKPAEVVEDGFSGGWNGASSIGGFGNDAGWGSPWVDEDMKTVATHEVLPSIWSQVQSDVVLEKKDSPPETPHAINETRLSVLSSTGSEGERSFLEDSARTSVDIDDGPPVFAAKPEEDTKPSREETPTIQATIQSKSNREEPRSKASSPDPSVRTRTLSPARKLPSFGDPALLEELYGRVPTPDSSPIAVPDSILSTVSAKKAWYQLTRRETLRQHNRGETDDTYSRVAWQTSGTRQQILKFVAGWSQQRLSSDGGMFSWEDEAPSERGKEDQRNPRPHQRKPSQDKVKSPVQKMPIAQFSWSSGLDEANAWARAEPPFAVPPKADDLREDIPVDSSKRVDSPMQERTESPRPQEHMDEEFQYQSPETSITAVEAEPPVVMESEQRLEKDDDDEWGDMVEVSSTPSEPALSSPPTPIPRRSPAPAPMETLHVTPTRSGPITLPARNTPRSGPAMPAPFFSELPANAAVRNHLIRKVSGNKPETPPMAGMHPESPSIGEELSLRDAPVVSPPVIEEAVRPVSSSPPRSPLDELTRPNVSTDSASPLEETVLPSVAAKAEVAGAVEVDQAEPAVKTTPPALQARQEEFVPVSFLAQPTPILPMDSLSVESPWEAPSTDKEAIKAEQSFELPPAFLPFETDSSVSSQPSDFTIPFTQPEVLPSELLNPDLMAIIRSIPNLSYMLL